MIALSLARIANSLLNRETRRNWVSRKRRACVSSGRTRNRPILTLPRISFEISHNLAAKFSESILFYVTPSEASDR
ncbi:hypothetical protein PUN28_012845 [Cardiocondyla obscurior]|uniref:Uncharacterized protein n=1 Tax=Cardiocondyla obscurior TaxID=286306 RepID=A0AAW2FAI5_9HYME